jgi:hypothetical protein
VYFTSTLSSVVRIKEVCTWCCNADSLFEKKILWPVIGLRLPGKHCALPSPMCAYVRVRKTSLFFAFWRLSAACFVPPHS